MGILGYLCRGVQLFLGGAYSLGIFWTLYKMLRCNLKPFLTQIFNDIYTHFVIALGQAISISSRG